jgi:hypothetical protein
MIIVYSPVHAQLSLAFVPAFMAWFVIAQSGKVMRNIVFCLALITAMYQAQVTAQLHYSDYIRYQIDQRIAYDINDRIMRLNPDGKVDIPIAVVGRYETKVKSNYFVGVGLGHSFFAHPTKDYFELTNRIRHFMQTLGINYNEPNREQMEKARKIAEDMPSYPARDSIRQLDDLMVIKLSQTYYRE